MGYSTFFSNVDPSKPSISSSQLQNIISQYQERHFNWNSSGCIYYEPRRTFYWDTHGHHTLLRVRKQQEESNKISTQQIKRGYLHLELQSYAKLIYLDVSMESQSVQPGNFASAKGHYTYHHTLWVLQQC